MLKEFKGNNGRTCVRVYFVFEESIAKTSNDFGLVEYDQLDKIIDVIGFRCHRAVSQLEFIRRFETVTIHAKRKRRERNETDKR